MRDRYDGLSKDVLVASLHDVGDVERGVESGTTTQRMDVFFRPDATHHAERLRRGLLGRLVDDRPCDLEPFRKTPSDQHVRDCVRKLCNHHHAQSLMLPPGTPPRPMERVVVLSPGRVVGAFQVFPLRAHETLPVGVYETHAEFGLWVVVIAELPVTRDTLALRLLGRGKVQVSAIEELTALPEDAWEHRLIEILLRWRQAVPTIMEHTNKEDEEFMEATKPLWEKWKAQFREEARTQGLSQGLKPLLHQIERRLQRPLSAAETATLQTRMTTLGPERIGDVVLDLSATDLAAWLADPAAR